MRQIISLERKVQKKYGQDILKQQLDRCVVTALSGSRGRGWSYKIGTIESTIIKDCTKLSAKIMFNTTSERGSLEKKLPAILQRLALAGHAGNLKNSPWIITEPTGYEKCVPPKQTEIEAEEPKTLGEINLIPGNHFDRIYGREPHIRRIMSVLKLAHRTNWIKRKNTLLDGPPGCCKSELMMATAQMLGKEGEAWRWFDATSMTKAGAIEEIMKSNVVPPVLFIEEIEKCEEAALRWLLGIMDTRGEIRRLNYRVGNQARNVRMVVIASANDVKLLKKLMSGALYSRFQNKIYCPPPDRDIMAQILKREVVEIDGSDKWIEPALEFGYDKWGIIDPREIVNIMSVGGDALLSGNYQKDHEETMHPQEKRDLLTAKKRREIRAEKLAKLQGKF